MPRLSARLGDLLRRRRWLALVAGYAVIEAAYVFFVSAGHFTHWPTTLTFLDDQAEGFRAGHLHFAIEPRRSVPGRPRGHPRLDRIAELTPEERRDASHEPLRR